MLKLENGRRALPGLFKTISLLCICASLAILCLLGLEAAAGKTVQKEEKKKPDGLELGLSEGGAKTAPEEAGKPVKATPLGEKETAAVLSRLGKEDPEAKETTFSFPPSTLPPPRPGTTIKEAFPPPKKIEPIAVPANEKLEVLRFQPEGSLPLASHLSVTFSEAMVPLDTHDALAAGKVPVKLTPEVKGSWRWVGTKTLFFETRGEKGKTRFPMASVYKVEIPRGTKSAGGVELKKEVSWTFTTPAPTIVNAWPQNGPRRLDPVMVLVFDQRINPEAVLEYITVLAGGKKHGLRMASEAELAADPGAKRVFDSAPADRRVAFRATDRFSTSSKVSILAMEGLPSLEGPLKTTKEQKFSFTTYAPFRVQEHQCFWNKHQKKDCPPGYPMMIFFNNPVDAKLFDASQVEIEPELEGMQVNIHGSRMQINGRSRPRTAYTVVLNPKLKDAFGQQLGKEVALSFAYGKAPRRFTSNSGPMTVVDPAGPPRFSVYTVNHETIIVDAYQVKPGNWTAYNQYLRLSRNEKSKVVPPGKKLFTAQVETRGAPDELTETTIDLRPIFEELGNQVILHIRPLKQSNQREKIVSWVQSTRLAIDAFSDGSKLMVWANSLLDGTSLANVEVEVRPHGLSGRTDKNGMVSFELPKAEQKPLAGIVIASSGKDTAFLPESNSWWSSRTSWIKTPPRDAFIWHVFDDRGMYKPGEEVRIKGWVRKLSHSLGGDLEPLPENLKRISYKVQGPRGNELAKGEVKASKLGGFDLSFRLPPGVNLGSGYVRLGFLGVGGRSPGQHGHRFQVQEFRRPEFEVSAEKSPGPHIVLGKATATVTAAYYAGGPLPEAPVNWTVSQSPGSYSPPGHPGFIFGTWVPWWRFGFGHHFGGASPRIETFTGKTDDDGLHRLAINFKAVNPPRPTTVTAGASVSDVNRQSWSANTTILVHPSSVYIGLRSKTTFVDEGKPLRLDSIVTSIDGKILDGKDFELLCIRQRWVQEKGKWLQKDEVVARKKMTSGKEPAEAVFAALPGGSYLLRAVLSDAKGRKNQSQLTLWVAGEKRPENRRLEQEAVTLVPDSKEYRAGDTARILAQLPFSPAEAVITLRRSGIVETRRVRVEGGTHTIEVPIRDDMVPGISVQIDLAGSSSRLGPDGKPDKKLPARPAYASGSIALKVPPYARALKISAKPAVEKLAPGGETTVNVTVHDAENKPVKGAEVAVVVIDEAILALSGYKLADPLQTFYPHRSSSVRDYRFRSYVQLREFVERLAVLEKAEQSGEVEMLAEGAAMNLGAPGGRAFGASAKKGASRMRAMADSAFASDDKAGGGGGGAIAMRSNFDALALFAAEVPTDADGTAQVKLKLPDSLTRYRIMVVGVAASRQFGSGESSITAELPLMVRPSPPRFLNYGDRFELPVVIQNRTEKPIDVQVALRGDNIQLTAGAGRKITVPATDRVEVRFPAAALLPGTARFQVAAVSGELSDAADVTIPVWTPASSEAFATYGHIDGSQPGQNAIAQTVSAPAGVIPGFGGIEITTSSTTLHALTDAYIYLAKYPYGCAEQVASRILATAALRDVLAAFKAEGLPDPKEMIGAVDQDLKKLKGLQLSNGGFGWWHRKHGANPYLSVHVAHALARARQKDFAVDRDMLRRTESYLLNINKYIPSNYPEECRNTIKAYSLYVRKLLSAKKVPDKKILAGARKLLADTPEKKLQLEAAAWLLSVVANDPASRQERSATLKRFGKRVTETASTAQFTTSYTDGSHLLLHSARRTDAIILEALINSNPQSDLVPKVVKGLLAHRTKGRWRNTQENAFVLLSLDRYFEVFEAEEPYFVARAWLGDDFAGEHDFEGRNTEHHHISIPMEKLDKKKKLVISKQGKGRLYYRLGLRYAPKNLDLEPSDHGFTVERSYEGIDDPADVKRDKDGTWRIRLGAKVRAKIMMVAPARRYHVALTDPLPAGLEPLNPALAVTAAAPPGAPGGPSPRRGRGWWWRGTWYQHQNLRDNRAEAFSSLVWAGVHSYSYVARATTPGTFVVPPAKAEEMYQPETFGRSASAKVIIE